MDGAEEGDAAAILVWKGGLGEFDGKGKGGRTLVQDAVELELLDQFGGCLGCHRELFLHSFSLLLPFYFLRLDYVIFKPLIKGVKCEN